MATPDLRNVDLIVEDDGERRTITLPARPVRCPCCAILFPVVDTARCTPEQALDVETYFDAHLAGAPAEVVELETLEVAHATH